MHSRSIATFIAVLLAPPLSSGAVLRIDTLADGSDVVTWIFPPPVLEGISIYHEDEADAQLSPAVLAGRVPVTSRPGASGLGRASLDRARLFLSAGAFDQVAATSNEILEQDPGNPEALLLRGVAEAGRGRHEQALADFDRVLKIGLDSAAVRQSRALSLEALGRADDAETEFSRVITLDPSFAEAYLKRGILRGTAGRFEDAAADFSRFIDLRPKNPVGYKNRAVALMKLGRQADARPDFIRAERLRQQ